MSHPKTLPSVKLESIRFVITFVLFLVPSLMWSLISLFIPRRSKSISGQLALVTGGSEGIGKAIAIRLAQEGCNIAIANRNHEKGQKVAEEIRRKFKVEAMAFRCDVANREDVKKLKIDIKATLGTVDLLVNNAGLMPLEHSLLEGDDEAYQTCMDVNLTSYIWTTRAFLPDMIRQRRGHIVGISSLSVQCPINIAVTYIATKFGNKGFIDGLREDMCFYGFDDFIKTTTVFSGFVRTNDALVEVLSSQFLEPVLLFSDADKVADTIVNGILKNKENIHVSLFETFFGCLINFLPRNIKTMMIRNSLRRDKRDEFIKMRLKNCGLADADVRF